MQKRNKREKQGKKEKRLLCVTEVSFIFCVTVTQKTENAKFTGKELTKQIFPDILIKVGLKSHEKSEKTRYYFVLLSEQEKKFRIII